MAQLSRCSKDLELRIGSQSCTVPKGLRHEHDIYVSPILPRWCASAPRSSPATRHALVREVTDMMCRAHRARGDTELPSACAVRGVE